MRFLVGLIRGMLLVALFSAAAFAAPPQQAQATTDAQVQKVLEISGAAANFREMCNLMLNSMRTMLLRSIPPNPRKNEFVNDFFEDARTRANRQAPEAVQKLVPVFEKYYSPEQIEDLLRFYESPLGQHMVQVQPQIRAEATTIGQIWGRQLARDVLADMRAKYPELSRK